MTNKKAALELPPIELLRAIKMLSSQVYFLPLNSICAIHVCSCIVRTCLFVYSASMLVRGCGCMYNCTTPFFGYNTKSIDLK